MRELVKTKSKFNRQEQITGLLMMLPASVFLIAFLVVPIFLSLYYSFSNYTLGYEKFFKFVNFDQYVKVFKDELFGKSILNTLLFTVIVTPLQCLVALGLAMLINKPLKSAKIFRFAYFSPVITSMTVIAFLWVMLYDTAGNGGLFNMMLTSMGLGELDFIRNKSQALMSIAIMSAWQGAGYQMMIILAGLQNVSKELTEAAELDGAGKFQKFKNVTVPAIMPILAFVFVTVLIGATKLFTQPFLMTKGGPEDSTRTIVYHIFDYSIQRQNIGYGSALSMVFIVAFVVINVGYRILEKLFKRRQEV